MQIGSLVRSMQNLVSLMAAGFAKEVFVYFLDVGAFVGSSVSSHFRVDMVQSLCSLRTNIGEVADICGNDDLTAAVYTAAGASHYLDKCAFKFAALYLFKQFLCVCKTRCHSNGYILACNVVGSDLNAFDALLP